MAFCGHLFYKRREGEPNAQSTVQTISVKKKVFLFIFQKRKVFFELRWRAHSSIAREPEEKRRQKKQKRKKFKSQEIKKDFTRTIAHR